MSHTPPHAPARLIVTILTHLAVDLFSFIIIPLLSVIEGRVHLTPWQGTTLVAVGSVASGLIQPIVALLSDRHDTRLFGTIGFAVAVLAIGSVGFAESFPALLLIQFLGAGGIGAFHPVAAATVGQLSGRRRATGLAWFYAAGMLGGVFGNLLAPAWVARFSVPLPQGGLDTAPGLRSLAWLIIPGLACVAALAAAVHSVPHRHATAHAEHTVLSRQERIGRWRSVWLLYFGNILRFTVDMCLITLFVRWSETIIAAGHLSIPITPDASEHLTATLRTEASKLNGYMQAARQLGMGAGGLVILILLRGRFERALLIGVPIAGALVIALTPAAASLGLGIAPILAFCALAGVGYGGVIPITLGLAQRLLPHRTSLASGLMLGGAWAFASVGPHLAQALFDYAGLSRAFFVVAIMLGASGVLGLMLANLPSPHAPVTRPRPVGSHRP